MLPFFVALLYGTTLLISQKTIFVYQKIKQMKKIYLLFLGLALSLQSCVTKEEIHVRHNGTVEYIFNVNFTELLASIPDKKEIFKGSADKLELLSGQEFSIDQILDLAMLNEKNGAHKKDSILKANKELFDSTKNIRFMANLNDSLGDFNIKISAKDVSDLNKSLVNIQKIAEETKKLEENSKSPDFMVESKYNLTSKVFERKVIAKEMAKKENAMMGGMEGMFQYIVIAKFDKPIKSVSFKDAKISSDGKSFEKSFSMLEIMDNPKILEYKVDFK